LNAPFFVRSINGAPSWENPLTKRP
jgi:hypothetical protein